MKKVVSLVLAVVLLFALSAVSFAADYDSPTTSKGPVLVDFSTETGVFGRIVVTPYLMRDTLSDEKREELEQAYDILEKASSIAELVGLEGNLTISDVFDISWIGDTDANPGKITITLSAEMLDHFKALLHFNGSEWEVIPGVKIDLKAKTLTFTSSDFSPYAIAIMTDMKGSDSNGNFADNEPTSPQTDDAGSYVMIAGFAILACAGLFLAISKKKSVVEK